MGIKKINEINRKILHILFAIVPIVLSFINDKDCLKYVIIFSIIVILSDIFYQAKLPLKIQMMIYRSDEIKKDKKLTGACWMSIACIISVILFKKHEYIPAMLAVAFCDTLAAFFGQKYGKHKIFSSQKTLEGFGGFLLGGIPNYIILNIIGINIDYKIFVIALFTSALFELIEYIDDNLSVMISFGFVIHIFS